jgi:hypothetical protein
VADETLRDLERRAATGDASAALALATALRRNGDTDAALLRAGEALDAGHAAAATLIEEILAKAPLDTRRRHVALLDRASRHAPGVESLLRASFPAFTRLARGEETRALREYVIRVAAGDELVRLRGPSTTANELTARAVHELSGRRGFIAGHIPEYGPSPWQTIFSHGPENGVPVLRGLCADVRARLVYATPTGDAAIPEVPETLARGELDGDAACALLEDFVRGGGQANFSVPMPMRNLLRSSMEWTTGSVLRMAQQVALNARRDASILPVLGAVIASQLRTGERFFD